MMSDSEINLISHFRAELGVGEAARRLDTLLTASGFKLNRVNLNLSKSRQEHEFSGDSAINLTKPSITFANPDQLGAIVVNHRLNWKAPLHIGYWAWELESAPRQFRAASSLLDQIWTLSKFSARTISAVATCDVKYCRLPVPIPNSQTRLSRGDFGLSENEFLVLSSFDFFSDHRRKGPEFAIDAFLSAFPQASSARLIVKTINGESAPKQLNELKNKVAHRSDVEIWDGYLNHHRNQALIELADVFISLHRSEGYGLNMADAMARKTAVIATAYSGNLDFMDNESSILVPYSLEPVEKYAGLTVNSRWAKPDVEFASLALKKLHADSTYLKQISLAGFVKIQREHSLSATVMKFRKEFL